jgi:hypothetical protein
MGLPRSWDHRKQNYSEYYVLTAVGTVTTSMSGEGQYSPVALCRVALETNGGAAALLKIYDSTSSADTVSTALVMNTATNTGTMVLSDKYPLILDKGCVIVVTTTGYVSIGFKQFFIQTAQ